MEHDARHGGPYDRGRADYFYGRAWAPHYFVGSTYTSDKIEQPNMTKAQLKAYADGYRDGESEGVKKDWG